MRDQIPHEQKLRYEKIYPASLCFCAFWILLAFLLDTPENIWQGLKLIVLTPDTLITDYIALAGIGAALVNSALVTLATLLVLWLAKDPLNGFTIAVLGLMSGFSLFGKDIFNIWPFILGAYCYARFRNEPFATCSNVGLLATCLSPIVSHICFYNGGGPGYMLAGILVGMFIGFVLPSLSAYTFKIQNGMNIYNMGFACGLAAMMIVPVIIAMGIPPESALYWATGYNHILGPILVGMCLVCIIAGFFFCNRPPWAAWAGYRYLLRSTGRAPNDFLRTYGAAPTLINMGVTGMVSIAYVLLIGGDLNGPVIGGIFTIVGFSAYGKHWRNVVPILLGMVLGGLTMQWNLTDPSSQIAGMFCTTLAPIAGCFGWPAGILAGFLHSALVLRTGAPVGGLNLYNNGFSAGLVAIVLYPTLTAIVRHRRPVLQDEDYFDTFEHDEPITPTSSPKD